MERFNLPRVRRPMSIYLVSNPSVLASAGIPISSLAPLSRYASCAEGVANLPMAFESESLLTNMRDIASERFGQGCVHLLSRSVLALNTGLRAEVIQRFPGKGDDPLIDFTSMINPVPGAPPVLLYREGFDESQYAFRGWMESLRALGHDVRVYGRPFDFEDALERFNPDIVGISATETDFFELAHVYRILARLAPETITILGGLAALPSTARFFDIVVPGEGDFILPLLLSHLKAAIKNGDLKPARDGKSNRKPRHIKGEAAEAVRALRTFRILPPNVHDGASLIPVEIGSKIFVGGCGYGDGNGDGRGMDMIRMPIPVNGDELKAMWSIPPGAYSEPEGMELYVQRGCKKDVSKRCKFCTIKSPAGRRMKVDDVLDILDELARRNLVGINFFDDNFISDKEWLVALLDGIEERGLHRRMEFYLQTRADGWTPDVVRRMWDMNMEMEIGLETMDALRAERMGKVGKGKGQSYVKKGLQLIELAAEEAERRGMYVDDLISAHLIGIGYGDGMEDLFRDILAQLKFLKGLRAKGFAAKSIPTLHMRTTQLPLLGDNITNDVMDPHYRMGVSKIREVKRLNREDFRLRRFSTGGVMSEFIPFVLNDGDIAEGMMIPYAFRYEPIMESLITWIRHILIRNHLKGCFNTFGFHTIVHHALSSMGEELAEHCEQNPTTARYIDEFRSLYEDYYGCLPKEPFELRVLDEKDAKVPE